MIGPRKDSLELDYEGDGEQQVEATVQCAEKQLPRCASIAPEGRYQDIRVEDIGCSHISQ
jgi:hypothetical protein